MLQSQFKPPQRNDAYNKTHKMSMSLAILPALPAMALLLRDALAVRSAAKELFVVKLMRGVGLPMSLFAMKRLFPFALSVAVIEYLISNRGERGERDGEREGETYRLYFSSCCS